mmetsp:Transcript_8802/g.13134  ORF Transcript_8802/g.13134 Transcript_8802/m.13134 type:complete len:577 (-) Transcript_8802:103-1833(-)|eukprot:CAMPEP_0203676720 /NCGR_PEP_ID=MMETSP0090-20130426/25533_1 /ASSEMBLY_ACC=CAM_ASM_001088 /TAXON_ID=426623 /ORGANISM="Chaetoceros affinis, Strain CCMP159" /LENGTH=576 /DNA_ID=CAMNT_0050543365 /DNA_START=222 /DNA_END=1952 /DNA_ORIENTATION=-
MRKHRSRRKNAVTNGNNNVAPNHDSNGNNSSTFSIPAPMVTDPSNDDRPPERKPTSPEEASLTAKNYRLAKELADLRMRHREETKTVTRLTMENMNLASRCRQAITHAEMLKKELTMYQKKSAENMQRQRKNSGPRRCPLEQSTSSNSIGEDEPELSKRPMATSPKTYLPQDNGTNQSTALGNPVASSREIIPVGTANNDVIEPDSIGDKEESDKFGGNGGSKRNRNRKFVSGVDETDVAFGELHNTDFFTGSYESTLPVTPEKENVDITALRDKFASFNIEGSKKESSSKEENSFDAFEASFQTAFPSSFAQTPSERNLSLEEIFNESDSFFVDAAATSKENVIENSHEMSPQPSIGSSKNKSKHTPSASSNFSYAKQDSVGSENQITLFPDSPMTAFENVNTNSSPESLVSTPSPKGKSNEKDINSLRPPSPPSGKQSGGAAARARYKYALSETDDENVAPMDEAQADKAETSPTLVLQRLHQRKAREKSSSNQYTDTESNGNGMTSMSEEIRKLDAIANGSHSRVKSGSRRRAVKQPISYAEPSLNSKLRRGDVFFPKNDVESEEKSKTAVTS